MSTYPDYGHCPEKCVFVVPITLRIPIALEPIVIGHKPDCVQQNGYKLEEKTDDTERVTQVESTY